MSRKTKSKKINASELSTLKMVSGNEKRYRIVVHDGVVKQWVGIGWIEIREAESVDRERYPEVVDGRRI